MSAKQSGRLDLIAVRAVTTTWRELVDAGTPLDENVNLASYAAEVIPQLCDELEEARKELERLRAVLAAVNKTVHFPGSNLYSSVGCAQVTGVMINAGMTPEDAATLWGTR